MESNLFSFFVSGEEKEVFPNSRLWELPLSGENTGFFSDIPSEQTNQDLVITIGDYFCAACRFLSENNFLLLKKGLAAVFKKSAPTDQIDRINIFLEKHGAFYHPMKVHVILNEGQSCSFVLNGAVSKPGLSLMEKEVQLITGLNKTYSKSYLPQVFGIDFIQTDKGVIGFFLGEWFEGYKEFHITEDRGERQVVIWESNGSCNYISEDRALLFYREISRILTYYYNIETFEQIFPWHHAAGDFIVRQEDGRVDVRLITVRGYSPLTEFSAQENDKKVHILPSLMFFFLNLTVRMRLDRLNGTGKTILLGKKIIMAAVDGFLHALDEKSLVYGYGELGKSFMEFFRQFSLEQVTGLLENILESCHPEPSEMAMTEENLESHCRTLHSIFKTL